MAQPYSTRVQVGNQSLDKLLEQAQWADPTDIEERIAEGDSIIDSRLAGMGYTLPFTSNPALVSRLSVLYARYACLRDLYQEENPSMDSKGASGQAYMDRFEGILKTLEEGRAFLLDSNNSVISRTSMEVRAPASGIAPFFNMDDPEELSQTMPDGYADEDLVGG